MSVNPIVQALEDAHTTLAGLEGEIGKEAARQLTDEAVERAEVVLSGVAHDLWAVCDYLHWHYADGPGADAARAQQFRDVGGRFAAAPK